MKRGTLAFAALEVVLVSLIPLLGWIGFRTVLDTTEGRAVDPELDPAEPGYEAFVEPTPTALAIGTDEAGALSWLTFLSLGGVDERGGAIVFVPPETLASGSGADTSLADLWATRGESSVVAAVADLLGAGFSDHVVIDPARMAELFAPVAPLELVVSDELPGFDEGEVALGPTEIAQLLLTRGSEETDLARLARHESVWRAWLAAVAASSDPNVVPGESATGIGRYVRGLAAGSTSIETAPVQSVTIAEDEDEDEDEGQSERFEADTAALHDLVEERVPFPVAAEPGARPRVRVLDGVGVEGAALQAAREVVRAGGQVTVLGNADRFDARVSRLVYFDAAMAGAAEAMGGELGIIEVTREDGPNPNELVDLTIVVGSDLVDAYGLPGADASP